MFKRSLGFLAFALTALPLHDADARSCHIVQCRMARAGEVCSVRPCQNGQTLACYSGRYTVGDGYRVWRNISQAQCEQRCENDESCNMIEYYFGQEGVKCNLYNRMPQVRWNSAQDATICVWE
jgi:hypothetical protein